MVNHCHCSIEDIEADQCVGDACGSQMVTLSFLKHIMQVCVSRYGSFERALGHLGLTEDASIRAASREFEPCKATFEDGMPRHIVIYAVTNGAVSAGNVSTLRRAQSTITKSEFPHVICLLIDC